MYYYPGESSTKIGQGLPHLPAVGIVDSHPQEEEVRGHRRCGVPIPDTGTAQPKVQPRPGDVRDSQADIGKARRILGYEPVVSFEDGLARTVAWYRRL